MKVYPDTNVLIDGIDLESFGEVVIGSVVLEELDKLKRSSDGLLAFKAREAIKLIKSKKYSKSSWCDSYTNFSCKDNAILKEIREIGSSVLLTSDMSMTLKAESMGVKYILLSDDDSVESDIVQFSLEDDDFIKFYDSLDESILFSKGMPLTGIPNNTYFTFANDDSLLFKKKDGEIKEIKPNKIYSPFLGTLQPKDLYQRAAIDGLNSSKVFSLKGPAGTGKSLISLSYCLEQLSRHNYNKLIMFCNPVPVKSTERLGYLPGDLTEKLLDTYVGNILASKLGDCDTVREFIKSNELMLLPFSSIRGFDTTTYNAIVWVTEAQNLSIELTKIALERVGDNSKIIFDGDPLAQIDVSSSLGVNNGLRRMSKIFKDKDFYNEVTLKNRYRSSWADYIDLL